LNTLDYKWPEIIRKSAHTENERIVYQSVEQVQSTNAGVNEKSHRTRQKESAQRDFIETSCNLINHCKFDKILLITTIESLDDLEYIDKNVSPFFPYTVVCVSFNVGFLSTDVMANYFVTFVDEADFDRCVDKGKRIGFKLQAHFVIEKIREFLFWSSIEFKKTTKPIGYKNRHFFVRNNVANGYASLNYLKQASETSLCDVYKSAEGVRICSSLLSAIDKLNWHSNDLASEYCTDMEVKTIWLPDLHDGTRLDVASVLVNMGTQSKENKAFL